MYRVELMLTISHQVFFTSTNHGITWSSKNTSFGIDVSRLIKEGSNLYAGAAQGVYFSSDKGNSWIPKNNGISIGSLSDLIVNNNELYACGNAGFSYSINNASTWQIMNSPNNNRPHSLFKVGNKIIVASLTQNHDSLYTSTNNGANWTPINFYAIYSQINKFAFLNNTILATNGVNLNLECVYVSSDTGNTWVAANGLNDQGNNFAYDFIANNGIIFLAAWNGIYKSVDNGLNWVNTGGPHASSFAIIGDTLYAGTGYQGIWKRSLTEIATSISETSTNNNFTIYPNPATSNLTINLQQLTHLQNTTVSIYDVQGKLLLQQSITQPQTEINIASFAKGIYVVKVNNDNNSMQSKFVKE